MKKIITLCLLALSSLTFAQEAGKKGELLKNEASSSEMRTQRNSNAARSISSNQTNNRALIRNNNPRYTWNQNNGYAEVFLRIPEFGYYTVEIDDQVMSSSSGKYRFFDLRSGRMMLSIYQDRYLVYRTSLNIRNNTRMVLDYFSNHGLYLLDSYRVQGQMYGFNEWDDVWNNPYNNISGFNNYPNTSRGVMDNRSFESFVQYLKKSASFDDNKLAYIQQQVGVTWFTSQQIAVLLDTFSFDTNRLKAGKLLFDYCADKQNFYTVYDSFDFNSNRQELMNYISNRR
ncbi:DUF4476 domain-containing protein [Flavobacterium sp. CBA20B-1]|uniref:DUF4476 domain-containing protein n=1 Tax=unclassified Flavobacterium TaxID=196869 RepID=UPI002224582F|nr:MULTISPECIES: DUF4476 domain-containing protein [unclassified Flavobacterium]WCM43395.1 DUF4476 domain-containing protein [Flavobacterium sp. CBA20B-1]